jgi:hypothetical protein
MVGSGEERGADCTADRGLIVRAKRIKLPEREQDAGSAMTKADMSLYRERVEQSGLGLSNRQARKALYTIRMLLRVRAIQAQTKEINQ